MAERLLQSTPWCHWHLNSRLLHTLHASRLQDLHASGVQVYPQIPNSACLSAVIQTPISKWDPELMWRGWVKKRQWLPCWISGLRTWLHWGLLPSKFNNFKPLTVLSQSEAVLSTPQHTILIYNTTFFKVFWTWDF